MHHRITIVYDDPLAVSDAMKAIGLTACEFPCLVYDIVCYGRSLGRRFALAYNELRCRGSGDGRKVDGADSRSFLILNGFYDSILEIDSFQNISFVSNICKVTKNLPKRQKQRKWVKLCRVYKLCRGYKRGAVFFCKICSPRKFDGKQNCFENQEYLISIMLQSTMSQSFER